MWRFLVSPLFRFLFSSLSVWSVERWPIFMSPVRIVKSSGMTIEASCLCLDEKLWVMSLPYVCINHCSIKKDIRWLQCEPALYDKMTVNGFEMFSWKLRITFKIKFVLLVKINIYLFLFLSTRFLHLVLFERSHFKFYPQMSDLHLWAVPGMVETSEHSSEASVSLGRPLCLCLPRLVHGGVRRRERAAWRAVQARYPFNCSLVFTETYPNLYFAYRTSLLSL